MENIFCVLCNPWAQIVVTPMIVLICKFIYRHINCITPRFV